MTVTVIYTPETSVYIGQGTYQFTFESIGADAFELWAVDATGARTFITTNDYTTEFNGATPIFDSGAVTITNDLPAGTTSISMERNTPITQLVDFQPYGRFPADVIEFALDKLTMICQELDARKCNIVDQLVGDTGP